MTRSEHNDPTTLSWFAVVQYGGGDMIKLIACKPICIQDW